MDLHTRICVFSSKCMKWVNDVCNIHDLIASLAIKIDPYRGEGSGNGRFQNSGVRTCVNAHPKEQRKCQCNCEKSTFSKFWKLTKI